MEFNQTLNNRVSIRKYSDEKPKVELVMEAIFAANTAPSPGNLPILKYVIVEDPIKISEIAKACQQPFVKQAKILVVVCSEIKKTKIMYEDRAEAYIKQHAGAAIENFLLKITEIGLASCWIGAFVEGIIKDTLMLQEGFNVEAVLPVGYRIKADKSIQTEKPSLDNRIYFNTWKEKFYLPPGKVRRSDL